MISPKVVVMSRGRKAKQVESRNVTINMSSDSPVIFKRSKAKPAARARPVSPEQDAETSASQTVEDSPSTLATKLKNKIKKTKTKSRLSFGGDDEVSFILFIESSTLAHGGARQEGDSEVFVVKKSNLSLKVASGSHPA